MNRLLVILLILTTSIILSCRNFSEFNTEDAERNSWLIGFLQNKTIIEGIYNYSEDIIELVLEVDSIDIFYSKADSIALMEGWDLNAYNPNFRVFSKEMKTTGNLSDVFIIKMEYISPNLLKINAY